MITKVLNPHTGRFWYYEIKQIKLSREDLEQLLEEIKKKLEED